MEVRVVLSVRLCWWLRPYLALTRLGIWLGLPLDLDKIRADIARGVKGYLAD